MITLLYCLQLRHSKLFTNSCLRQEWPITMGVSKNGRVTNYDTLMMAITGSNSNTPVIRSSQYRPTRTRELTVYKCASETVHRYG